MDERTITLRSGKVLEPNGGYVGINDAGDISEGWDGGYGEDDLTPAERIELADFMIARWQHFKKVWAEEGSDGTDAAAEITG